MIQEQYSGGSQIGQELSQIPFGEMISSIGISIAKAQFELDKAGTAILRMMSGVDPDTRVEFGGKKVSLLELGFTPAFYQFVETTIEIKMVIKMSLSKTAEEAKKTTSAGEHSEQSYWGTSRSTVATSQAVDAKYSQSYNYSAEGASMVRSKLVPKPPPPILEERIRYMMKQEDVARADEALKALGPAPTAPPEAVNNWKTSVAQAEADLEDAKLRAGTGSAAQARAAAEHARNCRDALEKRKYADALAATDTNKAAANTAAEAAEKLANFRS